MPRALRHGARHGAPRELVVDLVSRDHGELSLTIEMESTSADGERQVISLRGAAVRSLERGLISKDRRRQAWRANPHCLECGERIRHAASSGLLDTPDGPRIAHKRPCFITALARLNPNFSTRAAVARAEGR